MQALRAGTLQRGHLELRRMGLLLAIATLKSSLQDGFRMVRILDATGKGV